MKSKSLILNFDILLKGSPILTVEVNTEIFDAVHHFITEARRFINIFIKFNLE
jgi:hypothetical protein